MNKKIVYWIRHAESLSNISELNNQIIDPGLTIKGYEQCDNLRKYIELNNFKDFIELIVVSPLTRTLETCVNIIDNIPIIALDEIREHIDKPCHKRKEINNKKLKYKNINFNKIVNLDIMYEKFNGNEPKSNVINRCNWFIEWIKKRKEKKIIVITHGNYLLPMFSDVLKNINNKTFFSNCEIRKTELII
jgi:broad specificity phosphatase PhoE